MDNYPGEWPGPGTNYTEVQTNLGTLLTDYQSITGPDFAYQFYISFQIPTGATWIDILSYSTVEYA
jgi:hypothetical protein